MQTLFQKPTEMANLGWVYVSIAAGVLGIALLVLARIRSFQARPLRICFVLSICAHLLLLAVFYVSRVLELPYIPGSQPALVVRICLDEVTEDTNSTSVAPDEDPAKLPSPPSLDDIALVPTPTPVPMEEAETQDPPTDNGSPTDVESVSPPMEPPPDLLPANERASSDILETGATPSAEPLDAERGDELSEVLAVPDVDAAAVGAGPSAEREAKQATESPDALTDDSPPMPDRLAVRSVDSGAWRPKTDDGKVPRRYQDRMRRPTGEQLKLRGGSPSTERAVESALLWLAQNQAADGRWDAAQHGAGRGGWIEGQHRGSTGLHADNGITGLALLSFLGAGNTHRSGAHQETVDRALRYLLEQQTPSGSLGGEATIYAQMYCHGIATLALCEALAMTGDKEFQLAAQRAIDYTIASQHSNTGGWRYRPGDPGDTSQFGWQLMAIVSAREAKLAVPEEVVSRMCQFLTSVQSGAAGGLASYRPRHAVSRSMTAEALACRNFLGLHDERSNQEAIDYIISMKPGMGPRNFYYWYYATVALSQLECDEWGEWNHALQRDLLKTQRSSGPAAGSWEPNTVWGAVGGRVYTTAMATLCLESYYRYAK